MEDENRILRWEDAFISGGETCFYFLWEKGGRIYLRGEERHGAKRIFSQTLDLSKEEQDRALLFLRYLSESRTFPRMMASLAEEFFP